MSKFVITCPVCQAQMVTDADLSNQVQFRCATCDCQLQAAMKVEDKTQGWKAIRARVSTLAAGSNNAQLGKLADLLTKRKVIAKQEKSK